jgi:cobalamin biosynthesis protein CobT
MTSNVGDKHDRDRMSRIDLAMIAAYAMSTALERVGVVNEVLGFSTKEIPTLSDADGLLSGFEYSRYERIYMPIFKGFGESLGDEQRLRFASVFMGNRSVRLANNIDGECVEIAANRLMRMPQNGKLLIVLSDGAPLAVGNAKQQSAHLKRVVDDVKKKIGVVAVGINSNPSRYYGSEATAVLKDASKLPELLLGKLKSAIIAAMHE